MTEDALVEASVQLMEAEMQLVKASKAIFPDFDSFELAMIQSYEAEGEAWSARAARGLRIAWAAS